MENDPMNDTTKDASNICSNCGGLDNTSHICHINRFLDPKPPNRDGEGYLKKCQQNLDGILKKLRAARRESYMYVSQVSEAERILKERIKGQELAEIRHSQLAMEALSESLKIIDLMKGNPENASDNSGYSFNIPGIDDN
jgi:hypothetical protein